MAIEAVFLGQNPAGEKAYSWLNGREDVEVKALLTERSQLSLIEILEPDIVIASGFEHKVTEDIIEVPEIGTVNLHPSLLPFNRGSHPYIWSLVDGTPAGVSIHYMNDKIDEGPVIARQKVEKKPSDTAETLYERLQARQFELFKQNWGEIKRGVRGSEQHLARGTVHRSSELDELAEIDLGEEIEAGEFIDRLRGLSFGSRGLAFFEKDGERFFVELDITKGSELDRDMPDRH